MNHKNTVDRVRESRTLNSGMTFITSQNVGEVRRKCRQLMRAWAVAGRPEFGRNSISGYCRTAIKNNFYVGRG